MEALFAFLGGLAGSAATIFFSLHIFRQERWWEKKFAAYVTIVDSLHHMKRSYSVELKDIETDGNISENFLADLREKRQTAWAALEHAADIGHLLFNDASRAALNEFVTGHVKGINARQEEDSYSYFDQELGRVKGYLSELRNLSRRDLRLPESN